MSEGRILQKLDEQGKILEKQNKRLEEFSGEFKAIRQTLAQHSQILSGHGQILTEYGQKFQFVDEQLEFIRENMVVHSDLQQFHQEYLHDQDQTMTILKRLDEDRLFTHGRIDRVEKRLGLQTA